MSLNLKSPIAFGSLASRAPTLTSFLSRSCHFASEKKPPIACTTRKTAHNKTQKRQCQADVSMLLQPRMYDVPRIELPQFTLPKVAKMTAMHKYIEELNAVSAKNPMTTFYLAGPELAIGWLVSRFTSKFRQPANLALAAGASHIFPILSKVKVCALLGMISPPPEVKQLGQDMQESMRKKSDTLKAAGGTQKCLAEAADQAAMYAVNAGTAVSNAAEKLQAPIDKYATSYFLSSKFTSIGTIVGIAAAVNAGVDIPALMQSMGMSSLQDAGTGMSCMAAAVIINTVLLPAHLLSAMKLAPGVGAKAGELERRYYAWLSSMEEGEGINDTKASTEALNKDINVKAKAAEHTH